MLPFLSESVAAAPSLFPPPDAFREKANVQSLCLFEEASQDREAFWASQAKSLVWFRQWDQVLTWDPPHAQWFVGGKLNASYNCLDRHMDTPVRNKLALIWEGENAEERAMTYEDLYREVNKFSNVLKSLGIRKGDKVAIYLPMVPEAVVAMLSCARIGAVHTVIFAGFSSEAVKDRILDAEAKLLITADGGLRKGKIVPLKEMADRALEGVTCVKDVIVLRRTGEPILFQEPRDHWYDLLMRDALLECPPEVMDAEDELYILYTSGTTGKPKGVVHTTGGYMVGATISMQWVFDIKPSDVYWCTADIGWVTGHSYVVYGPLSNGVTQLMYEGVPDFPERDRFWKLIEKYKVTILYTAPTAIRTFMKWGEEWPKGCDLSSLRLLGSVGEPINPEAWIWYHQYIGQERCPVVDTWWQTETGSIMIAPLPGVTPLKPGSATHPLPGIDVAILDDRGQAQSSGYLVITSPWPSMLRGIYKDPARYKETYWKKWEGGYYFAGDGAKRDEEGYFWLTGRVDDVINVSGHRLGTMEIESALVDSKIVAESAVIAVAHPIKGQAIVAFVSLKEKTVLDGDLENALKQHVVKKIGAIARPERIIFICDLPKTRSGKIMRRLLRDIAEGRVAGDTTTLSDPSVIESIKGKYTGDDQ
jgi:acetyl-CoA synthetase